MIPDGSCRVAGDDHENPTHNFWIEDLSRSLARKGRTTKIPRMLLSSSFSAWRKLGFS